MRYQQYISVMRYQQYQAVNLGKGVSGVVLDLASLLYLCNDPEPVAHVTSFGCGQWTCERWYLDA
jgi:hypothetical protein